MNAADDQDNAGQVDQDADQDAPIEPVGALQRVDQDKAIRLAQAIEGAAIDQAAEVSQAFTDQAINGRSWRAQDAWLARFLDPIRDRARADQDGADLPRAIEDGSLAELVTDLAERIAIRGGLDLAQVGPVGGDRSAQDSPGQGSGAQDSTQEPASFADRLDSIRTALIQARVTGADPGPRQEREPPPHPRDGAAPGGRGRETMEPPHGRFSDNIGGHEVIEDAEFTEETSEGGDVAREAMMRDRRSQGGSDESEGAS